MHCSAMNLWLYLSICWSVYLCIRSQLENASSRICLDGFLWYLGTVITRWGGGWQKVCSGIWGQRSSRDHLGSLFKYTQNASSSTWFNRFWWNLGEEILGQIEVLSGCSGIFDGRLSWGHLGSVLCWRSNFRQTSTTNLTMSVCWSRLTIKKRSWRPLHPICG